MQHLSKLLHFLLVSVTSLLALAVVSHAQSTSSPSSSYHATTTSPPTSLTLPITPRSADSATRSPMLMLSTMDGTVSVFDASSGKVIFTYHDSKPAVQTWSAPGHPEYVPSLDGFLYRIDRETQEAHVVEGKFISRDHASNLANVLPASALDPSTSDAVVLTSEESSLLYIDMRAGRVLRETRFDDKEPPPPDPISSRSDLIIVVQRTTVAVRIVDTASGRELANATYVHTDPRFWQQGRCVSPTNPSLDKFAAYATDTRDKVIVRNIQTGEVVWSKDVATPVVEAHGLGGVRIVSTLGEWMAIAGGLTPRQLTKASEPRSNSFHSSRALRHVVVADDGRYLYATMLGANLVATEKDGGSNGYKNVPALPSKYREYTVANVDDVSTLGQADKVLNMARLPRKRNEREFQKEDVALQLTSTEAGISFLIFVMVGLIGYVVGSRPKRRRLDSESSTRNREPKRYTVNENGVVETGRNTQNEDSEESIDDRFTTILRRGQRIIPGVTHQALSLDGIDFNASQESSSGSGGGFFASNAVGGKTVGGFNPNRTGSGWMTVGCLRVSTKVLGVGSHGTVVYEGKLMPGERKVAVKRLLRQFYESARKEISLLVELDEASPHVVRYFAMEEDSEFIYLALELCANSLADCIANRKPPVPLESSKRGPPPSYTSHALRQLMQGLADLHRAGVVHRDVKPQNVLITRPASGGTSTTATAGNNTTGNTLTSNVEVGDIKLADVGLALRLGENRSSYTAVSNAAGGLGTTGWRAPEVLNGGRQTKAVDIFAAGCVVSSVLTGGDHPFGNAIFGRDGNIASGTPTLDALESLQLPEATDIVRKMIDPVASKRPSADDVLTHPFFWTDATKLSFLVDISDRLYDLRHHPVRYTENLDRYPLAVTHCSKWIGKMDVDLLNNLGRGYEDNTSGLLRVVRNKKNHYSELPSYIRQLLGPLPEEDRLHGSSANSANQQDQSRRPVIKLAPLHDGNFLTYFTRKIPMLLMCIYRYALENPALISQPHFTRYGLKPDWSRKDCIPPPHNAPSATIPSGSSLTSTLAPTSSLTVPQRTNNSVTLAPKSSLSTPVVSAGLKGSRFAHIATNNDDDSNSDDDSDDEDKKGVESEGDKHSTENGKERNSRTEYHRHQLVDIQALRPDVSLEVRRRLVMCDVYHPSAFERYKKRLVINEFGSDNAAVDASSTATTASLVSDMQNAGVDDDVPVGFSRTGPRKNAWRNGIGILTNNSNNNGLGNGEREVDFGALRRNR